MLENLVECYAWQMTKENSEQLAAIMQKKFLFSLSYPLKV